MFSSARPRSSVCLSVCVCARLLTNACMDLDGMLRVDRCWDMDELINLSPIRIIVRIQEPDLDRFLNFSRISQQVMDRFR